MILNVYKDWGWSSFDVVKKLKSTGQYKKIGHAGTLDPLAEGVLLILTDSDTKKQPELMALTKEYLVDVLLGYTSPSYDLGTEVSKTDQARQVTITDVENALPSYIGNINQRPPLFSAKHIRGTRAYKLARSNAFSGLSLNISKVTIYDITACSFLENVPISYTYAGEVRQLRGALAKLKVVCGKGTYIRALARDIGEDLQCGGVVTKLVRTKIGEYALENSLKLEEFIKQAGN